MEIVRENLPWSSQDIVNWTNFLDTETGRRLLPKLAEKAPTLLGGGDTNSVLIRSGELRGFQLGIQELLALTTAEPLITPPPVLYPPLDQDSAWETAPGVASQKIE